MSKVSNKVTYKQNILVPASAMPRIRLHAKALGITETEYVTRLWVASNRRRLREAVKALKAMGEDWKPSPFVPPPPGTVLPPTELPERDIPKQVRVPRSRLKGVPLWLRG